ncbi:hypothetical protein ACFFP0_30005 [Rhizobium puerariae]|uniref:Histidine kinase n=1 Tax=Rhizobium puerariae TaxID=1585791 RepID=A0ABV6AR47_9HYPH
MVALLFILACIAVLAAVFAIVVQQMAAARRQHHLDELAADALALDEPVQQRKAARRLRRLPAQNLSSPPSPRRRVRHKPPGHPPSALMTK